MTVEDCRRVQREEEAQSVYRHQRVCSQSQRSANAQKDEKRPIQTPTTVTVFTHTTVHLQNSFDYQWKAENNSNYSDSSRKTENENCSL